MKKRAKIIVSILGCFIVLMIMAYLISSATKNLEIDKFTRSLGWFGPLFLTLGIAIGGIIVPLTSLPFLLAGLALYGFWPTFIFYYLGNTVIAPIINFWIARKWGRPAVVKLSGKVAMKQIDQIVKMVGVKALVILRFFGGILFDSISYAVGLTNIGFKMFLFLTMTLPIPGMVLCLYLIHKGLISNPVYLAIIVIWGYLAGVITTWWIYKEGKKIR